MKLWNTSGNIDKLIEDYTIGDDPIYDMRLAQYDVKGSIAHAKMLQSIGYLTEEEASTIDRGLREILVEVEEGNFEIAPGIEDIHSQVEFVLTDRYGDVGKKLHVGRSRNDQIALDLKLYYRDLLNHIKDKVKTLGFTLLAKAESTESILMPGYTHSQAGMVSSFGLWYSSFAESLADDYRLLDTISELVDQNPLGSAAGYGSSLPNDRNKTTNLLEFQGILVNAIYAQTSRGKVEVMMGAAFSSIALTINRLASDICIFSNENYAFLKLPHTFTTGSSIMPHKRNPDVLELTRAKCNQIMSLPGRLQLLLTNMQTGYHRDYQLLKEIFFPEADRLQHVLEVVNYCLPEITENPHILKDDKYKYCFTVEVINEMVKQGTPFRDAYHAVKKQIAEDTFQRPVQNLEHTHLGSIGNLGLDEIREKF